MIDPDQLAATTIWQEARGEPMIGKIAVGLVILNRMKRKYQSDGTVAGTVLKPHQFSGWNTDANARSTSATSKDTREEADCREAWFDAKVTHDRQVNFPAVLYHSKSIDPPKWASHPNVKKVAEIGNHIFYDEVTE